MEKNWHKAPWVVKLLFIYWVFPLASSVLGLAFIAVFLSEGKFIEIWLIPFELIWAKIEAMPISSAIDIGMSSMYFAAVYFAWKLVKGSGLSRLVLQIFSWIIIAYTSINLLFPGLRYLELKNISPSLSDTPIDFLILGISMVCVEVIVLYMLRTVRVQEYANVF